MDARLRIGLIIGIGTAVPTFIFALTSLGVCGPIIAIMGGVSAGLQSARDPRFARNPVSAGTLSGLTAGVITGLAQLVGMLISAQTPLGRSSLDQARHMLGITATEFAVAFVIDVILIAALDIGLMVGCGALSAYLATRNRAVSSPRYSSYPAALPPQRLAQPVLPPTPPPMPQKPLPTVYPPPPGYYGLPDVVQPADTGASDTPHE